eukprot:414265_1
MNFTHSTDLENNANSPMQYVNGLWRLANNTNGCVDIPTIAPTLSPTIPPTHALENPVNQSVIVSLLVVVITCIIGLIYYYFKYYKFNTLSLYKKCNGSGDRYS